MQNGDVLELVIIGRQYGLWLEARAMMVFRGTLTECLDFAERRQKAA